MLRKVFVLAVDVAVSAICKSPTAKVTGGAVAEAVSRMMPWVFSAATRVLSKKSSDSRSSHPLDANRLNPPAAICAMFTESDA